MGVERVDYYSEEEYQQAAQDEREYYNSQEQEQEPEVVPCFRCGGQMYQECHAPEGNICKECTKKEKVMPDQMNLTVFDPIKAAGAELQKKDECQEFDHTTPGGEKALRSWVHRVRGHKADIERARVATKAQALQFGRQVDELARQLTGPAETIIAKRMKPLDEIEAEKRRQAEAIVAEEERQKEIAEQERLAELQRREEEVAAKEKVICEAEEKRQAEIAEQDRIAREKRIAEEAAEQAQIDAAEAVKKAEQEKQEAIERAEREKQEAIEFMEEKVRKEAEAKENERLAGVEAERVKKQEATAKEEKRRANVAHRTFIEDEAYDDLMKIMRDPVNAHAMLEAIKNGAVKNVVINY